MLCEWFSESEEPKRAAAPSARNADRKNDQVRVVYGNASKRRCVRDILEKLLEQAEPCTLMVFSDEGRDWFAEDAAFAKDTARALLELVQRGCIIERILPRLSSISDAQESFSMWLPMYLTGNVKPYYLPVLRDGIVRRTLLIAQGMEALFSTSVGRQPTEGAAYSVCGHSAVESCEKEFSYYRAMCSPAIQYFDPYTQSAQIQECMRAYYEIPSASIRVCDGLSFISMPEGVKRVFYSGAQSALAKLLMEHSFNGIAPDEHTQFSRVNIDIMRLSTKEEVSAGEVRYFLDDMRYTPELFKEHILNIVRLLERYQGYNAVFSDYGRKDCAIYAKRDEGALIFLTNAPYLMLNILAPDMFNGLWKYLEMQALTDCAADENKRRVIHTLKSLASKLTD